MTTQLWAGSLSDFDDSMAGEIEKAMNDLLTSGGMSALPADDSDQTAQRRRLFIAIASGVITHLQKREQAIEVTVTGVAETVTPKIQVRTS
jgi:hypothetical protein